MSDGFSFLVKYVVTSCISCPHIQRHDDGIKVRNYCMHNGRENSPIPDTVWVTDEIDPNCPMRVIESNV